MLSVILCIYKRPYAQVKLRTKRVILFRILKKSLIKWKPNKIYRKHEILSEQRTIISKISFHWWHSGTLLYWQLGQRQTENATCWDIATPKFYLQEFLWLHLFFFYFYCAIDIFTDHISVLIYVKLHLLKLSRVCRIGILYALQYVTNSRTVINCRSLVQNNLFLALF